MKVIEAPPKTLRAKVTASKPIPTIAIEAAETNGGKERVQFALNTCHQRRFESGRKMAVGFVVVRGSR